MRPDEQPEPACHCSPLELDDGDAHADGRWRVVAVVATVFAVAIICAMFSLLMGCASSRHVSRSYEVCHMACERVGCSRADAAQVCSAAEALP